MAGDAQTALCIIQMDEGLDTGDVLLREPLDIADDATSGWLHDIMVEKAGGALLKVLCDLSTITPTPQNENGATYAKKIDKAEAMIDWNKPADAVYNLIRGLNPYPGAKFICNGEAIKILSAQMEEGSGKAGEVLNNQLLIACEKGTIRPLTLQRPGKQPMPASEMLKGFPIAKGVVLS
jgi:methionyl-tRNA formyltransferase